MPIAEATRLLVQHRVAGTVVERLAEADRPADLDHAYRIQDAVHARLAETRFGRRIGWKIGCTTRVMQDYLGVPSPCAAGLFEGTRHKPGVVLRAGDFRRIGIECEIALRLGRDLDARGGVPAPAEIAAAIESAMAAVEIVDDRYADWRTTDAPTLIADDFFAAGCVLGPETPLAALPDLATLKGATIVNGVEVGRGSGADVLGHPFAAIAFLASNLFARGLHLHAGEIVLTGSLVETRWLVAGDSASIAIDGLGTVELSVGA